MLRNKIITDFGSDCQVRFGALSVVSRLTWINLGTFMSKPDIRFIRSSSTVPTYDEFTQRPDSHRGR